jgi:hypothetical protein
MHLSKDFPAQGSLSNQSSCQNKLQNYKGKKWIINAKSENQMNLTLPYEEEHTK